MDFGKLKALSLSTMAEPETTSTAYKWPGICQASFSKLPIQSSSVGRKRMVKKEEATDEPVRVVQRSDNGQKFTSFKLLPAINQKNYFTGYLKKDSQYLASKPRDRTEEEGKDPNVIVYHLGSRNMRVGLSMDGYPKTVPMCVARPKRSEEKPAPSNLPPTGEDGFDEALEEVKRDFKERMKFYRTRVIGNASETCRSFNARQDESGGETVPAADDLEEDEEDESTMQVDTSEPKSGSGLGGSGPKNNGRKRKAVGTAAQALSRDSNYELIWPILRGRFNDGVYSSSQELLGDVIALMQHGAIQAGVSQADRKEFDVVLVVSDIYDKVMVESLIDILFNDLGFANVSLIQESVAATFGAGVSCATIIDVGAQTTTISCVEEGFCVPDSRIRLDYGGDDISVVYAKLLERIELPTSSEWELAQSWSDFALLEELKQKYCTTNESDITVQLYSFIRRVSRNEAKKYSFKIYNEVMLPILGLFYPELFCLKRLESSHTLFPRSRDGYDDRLSDPVSDAQISAQMNTLAVYGMSYHDKVAATASIDPFDGDDGNTSKAESVPPMSTEPPSREGTAQPSSGSGSAAIEKERGAAPGMKVRSQRDILENLDLDSPVAIALDHAIIESISQTVQNTITPVTSSAKVFYENIMVIGGGAKFSGFHQVITDRLIMWNQEKIKDIGEVAVMAVPREIDPEIIVWKGATVYSKLKVCDEMWVSRYEWEMLGSRVLQTRAIFMY